MADIKDKSIKDLQKLLTDKRSSLQKFRFGISGSKTRNIKEGRNTKREVAQILTELRKRELEK